MLEPCEAEQAVSRVQAALDEAGAADISIIEAEGTIFTVEDAAGTLLRQYRRLGYCGRFAAEHDCRQSPESGLRRLGETRLALRDRKSVV